MRHSGASTTNESGWAQPLEAGAGVLVAENLRRQQ